MNDKKQSHLLTLTIISIIVLGSAGLVLSTLIHYTSPSFKNSIEISGLGMGTNTRGAAWADYDNDGYIDLLTLGRETHLYRNLGKDTFRDVTKETGLSIVTNSISSGAFGDYDNDGCTDLYLAAGYGSKKQDFLLHNNCNGTFTDVTLRVGLLIENFSGEGVAWADYDNDGYLDIYVANHGVWERTPEKEEYFSEPNILYHNNGDGTFTNSMEEAHVSGATNCIRRIRTTIGNKVINLPYKLSYQPLWFDYNDDGNIDLFVATDGGISPLYRNEGNGTFIEVTKEAGLCRTGTGMGVAVGDYDNDLDLDIYVTNIGANFLWSNNGDETFTEVAAQTRTADHNSIGWGTGFLDYDNDQDLDLYVTNGIVNHPFIGEEKVEDFGKIKFDRLFRNNGNKTFTEVTEAEGIYGDEAKESAVFADFNNDGFVDIYVGSSFRSPETKQRLYQNKPNGNNWITIKLTGTTSNRDAIGAKIIVSVGGISQMRQVVSGSSYIAQNSLWQTFGLGKQRRIEKIEIIWPSEKLQLLHTIKPNQLITITEE